MIQRKKKEVLKMVTMDVAICDHCHGETDLAEVTDTTSKTTQPDYPRDWIKLSLSYSYVYKFLCSWECVAAFGAAKALNGKAD